MPLTIIKGPPNSGRTEQVRREYMDLLPQRPVMVVPSVDDIFDWEKRLARSNGALLGGRIMHFKDLITEVLDLASSGHSRVATPLERRHLVDLAFSQAWPEMRERVGRQPGLRDSMLQLIDEFRQSLIDPDNLEGAILEISSSYLDKIAAVYRFFVEALESRRLTDAPAQAMKSARVSLDDWQGRPIFLVGFDDLTKQQLELISRLSEQTEVTVAITHEVGNPAMAVTENLLGRLEALGAVIRETTSRPDQPDEHNLLLYQVERDFMRQEVKGSLEPGDSVTVMHSSGQRGEAEAVAARIASLVDSGIDPGQIAIAVDNPKERGARFRDLLSDYEVPVTLETETGAADTAVGRAVLVLLQASSPSGTAADFIRYLRGPSSQEAELVDRLEHRVLRGSVETAREAASIFNGIGGSMPPGWVELTAGETTRPPLTEAVASAADQLARNILAQDPGTFQETQQSLKSRSPRHRGGLRRA
ncbi:MAG: hypothetical protein IPK93_09230 [Solirubrobacterales bacterium]|nr:hypothetical protein [Solirubrobacterales bacterium]